MQRIGAEMTTALMNAFRERIDTLDWLDEETIKRAEKKVILTNKGEKKK